VRVEGVSIWQGDARELIKRIPDKSVDLVFTDPPYLKEYLPLYSWLSEQAERVLKPDGFLLTYTGGYHKGEVMERLGEHLEYFYDFVLMSRGDSTVLHPKHIVARCKFILAYRKRGSKAVPKQGNVLGVIEEFGKDKRYHPWGQAETAVRYLLDCFSEPGDFVLDPFAGGGTVPYVCQRMERRCIGFEIDPESAETARNRLAGWKPPEKQLQLFEVEEGDLSYSGTRLQCL